MVTQNTGKKLGLALSGGTLKAAAHVGVLDALESLGLQFDCVAGTSAGSYVATLYAHGFRPKDMMKMVEEFPGLRLLDYGFPVWSSLLTLFSQRIGWSTSKSVHLPSGLLRGYQLERYFRRALKGREPEIPCYVIATDLYSGAPVVYGMATSTDANQENEREQIAHFLTNLARQTKRQTKPLPTSIESVTNTARVIRGSCALPGIFTPVVIGEHLLVDGGLRSYVPVEILRAAGCTHILAVNLYRLQEGWKPETFAHVLSRSFDIILDETINGDIQGDDVFSISPDVSHISWLSFKDMRDSVKRGRVAVFENERELSEFLSRKSPVDESEKEQRTRNTSPVLTIGKKSS